LLDVPVSKCVFDYFANILDNAKQLFPLPKAAMKEQMPPKPARYTQREGFERGSSFKEMLLICTSFAIKTQAGQQLACNRIQFKQRLGSLHICDECIMIVSLAKDKSSVFSFGGCQDFALEIKSISRFYSCRNNGESNLMSKECAN